MKHSTTFYYVVILHSLVLHPHPELMFVLGSVNVNHKLPAQAVFYPWQGGDKLRHLEGLPDLQDGSLCADPEHLLS